MANSAVVGILRAILTVNSAEFETAMKRSADSARTFSRETKQIGLQATQVGMALTKTLTLPIVAFGGTVAKLAIDFESSFAGIRKTVGDATDQFGNLTEVGKQLAAGMRGLSKEIPINVNELNRIGEVAGQLGIKSENIVGFTEVMAKLGVTTNLTSDQAATSLARLANITKMPQTEFERLGSTIVALGNNYATTEAEIVEFGLRIAAAGAQAKMSEADILGIGTALSSVGVEAEAGGTAVQKVILSMVKATVQGGDKLELFARTAGMSAAGFKKAFQDDAANAFTLFVEGLGAQGQKAINTLDKLGLEDQRLIRSFLALSGAGDLLRRSIETGNTAWEQNTALTREAEQRFGTTASQLTLLWNRVKDVGITFGNALLPMIKSTIGALDTLIPFLELMSNTFAALPTPLQASVVGFGLVVAAAGPALFVFGQLALATSAVASAFTKKGIATRALAALLGPYTAATTTAAGATRAAGGAAGVAATRFTLFGSALGVAARALAVFAAATVGWTLGSAIGEIRTFGLSLKEWVPVLWNWKLGLGETSLENLKLAETSRRALSGMEAQADESRRMAEAQGQAAQSSQQLSNVVEGTTIAALFGAAGASSDAAEATEEYTKALDKLLAQFRGQGVIEQARLYEDALGRIGGTSKLTGEEQEEFVKVFSDVIEKYRAMGPAGALVVKHFEALLQKVQPTVDVMRTYTAQFAGLAQTIESAGASHSAYNIITARGTTEVLAYNAALAAENAELMRLGMLLPNLAIQSDNVSHSVAASAKAVSGVFGNLFAGMKGSLSNLLKGMTGGEGIGGFFKNLGGGIVEGFGNIISGGLSSLISSGVGLAVKGLGNLFGGIFGIGKSEGRKQLEEANADIKKLQDDLLKTHGSLERIREVGGAAGHALADAWGSQNRAGLEHFKTLLGEFNEEMERQGRTADLVNDILGTDSLNKIRDLEAAYSRLTPEQLENDRVVENLVTIYKQLRDATGQTIPGLEELAKAHDVNAKATERNRQEAERARGSFATLTDNLSIFQARMGNTESVRRMEEQIASLRRGGEVDMGALISEFERLRESVGTNHPAIKAIEEVLVHFANTGVFEFDKISGALATLGLDFRNFFSETEAGARRANAELARMNALKAGKEQAEIRGMSDQDFVNRVQRFALGNARQRLGREDVTADEIREFGDIGRIQSALGADPDKVRRMIESGDWNFFSGGGVVYAAHGRVLPFMPRGTDTVPAMLTPGEGVVNRWATSMLGGESGINAINAGKWDAVFGRVAGLTIPDPLDVMPALTMADMGMDLPAFEDRAAVDAGLRREMVAVRSELAGMRRDLLHVLPMIAETAARHGAQTSGRRR